ncbi:MAG: hypothetical protein ACTSUY_00615 [Alphaproteobacteria bacterium]
MTAPRDLPYTIAGRELVAQFPGMRVQVLTLACEEKIPWHYHNTVSDIFVCLIGATIIETTAPWVRKVLAPGEHYVVSPKIAHQIVSKGASGCQFSNIQGVGDHDFNLVGRGATTEQIDWQQHIFPIGRLALSPWFCAILPTNSGVSRTFPPSQPASI